MQRDIPGLMGLKLEPIPQNNEACGQAHYPISLEGATALFVFDLPEAQGIKFSACFSELLKQHKMLHTAPGSPNILVAGTGPQPLEDPKRGKTACQQGIPDFVVARPDSCRAVRKTHSPGETKRHWTHASTTSQRDKESSALSKTTNRLDSLYGG